jgi:beta-N-acetylhexosaminidase
MVFGPLADVLLDYDNRIISRRVFAGDPELVSEFVSQAVTGYRQAGLIPVLKHFPGHGGVAGDTHRMLPVDDAGREDLEISYLPPFRSGLEAGSPAVMLSHVAFPNISGAKDPSSLSEEVIALLRDDLGFQGLVVTDALDMEAVLGKKTTLGEVSQAAISAGVDMLLLTSPEESRETYEHLLAAAQAGEISTARLDDAVRRILSVKARQGLDFLSSPVVTEPDWIANAHLADEAGRRGVTLYKDARDWIPLSTELKRFLVIGPNDSLGSRLSMLDPLFKERGYSPEYVFYSQPERKQRPPQELGYLSELPARARQYDLTLIFTSNAHLDRVSYDDIWQVQMVQSLVRSGRPLVVIAIGSPTDLIEFPEAPAYLATFGTNPSQMAGLLDILAGRQEPVGVNPLPGLP